MLFGDWEMYLLNAFVPQSSNGRLKEAYYNLVRGEKEQ